MRLKEIFKKQGGLTLVKRYIQNGVICTAVGEFLLLGKSRTALEILRLATQLKVKQRLVRKYKKKLLEFDSRYDSNAQKEQSNKVWICWLQGMENAPELVRSCYQSVQANLKGRDIILITLENMTEYVQFPQYIIDKWQSGQITDTHLSDLLRLELLIKYGGMWLDATVICTTADIPDFYFTSDLFFYQCLKPGRDGHSTIMSSWLISASSNNKVLMATRYLCYCYWKTNQSLVDYFLFHNFMTMALEHYEKAWMAVVPKDNATPHVLSLRLFDDYDKAIFEQIVAQSPFHKLGYKFAKAKAKQKDTNYDFLLRQYQANDNG